MTILLVFTTLNLYILVMKDEKYPHNLKISSRLQKVLDQLESVEIFDSNRIGKTKSHPMGIGANDEREIPPKS